jgi:hypothetical protein
MTGVNMRLKAGAIREMHWHMEDQQVVANGKSALGFINPIIYSLGEGRRLPR